MKTHYWLMLTLALAPLAQAEPPSPNGPPPGPAAEGKGRGRMSPAERLEHLSTALSLTDEQKAKLKTLLEGQAKIIQDLREDESLTKEDRRAKVTQLRETHRTQIAAILTPEQKKKFAEMEEKREERQKKDSQTPAAPQT